MKSSLTSSVHRRKEDKSLPADSGRHRRPKVGFDFDGVIAYNPFRIIRAPVAFVKRNILGIKHLSFFYPKSPFEKLVWRILHDSSIFPAQGIGLLREMVQTGEIEAHLVTARYSFLDDHLNDWLVRNNLKDLFKTITINRENKQPHLFKEEMIRKHGFDYFIEDNFDIVTHLRKMNVSTVLWITNILDSYTPSPHKYPHLKHALHGIRKSRS